MVIGTISDIVGAPYGAGSDVSPVGAIKAAGSIAPIGSLPVGNSPAEATAGDIASAGVASST